MSLQNPIFFNFINVRKMKRFSAWTNALTFSSKEIISRNLPAGTPLEKKVASFPLETFLLTTFENNTQRIEIIKLIIPDELLRHLYRLVPIGLTNIKKLSGCRPAQSL